MPIKLKNNVVSTLATAINASDVGLAVAPGTGVLFPTLTASDYFYATLVSAGGAQEVVRVTARVGDTMTIQRGQDDSTPQSFAAGSRIEMRINAQAVADAAGSINRAVVYVDAFGAVGDGVADDTTAIRNAFNATPRNGTVEFGVNKTYRITGTIFGYDISIEGNGSTLVSTGPFAQLRIRQLKGPVAVNIPATAGQTSFDLGVTTTVAVGDLVKFRSNTERLPLYFHGFYATVIGVTGTTISVDRSCYANFNIDNVDIYGASDGVVIRHLNGVQTFTQAGSEQCWQVIGNNVVFEGCTLIGSPQTARGITGLGTNITVRSCFVQGFLNIDGMGPGGGRVGYGSEIHGNNILWENCAFVECKDGTSTGSRDAICTNVTVRGCSSFARSNRASASFDAHSNVLDDFIVDGCYSDTSGKCVNVRNGSAIVQNSYFKTNATSVEGVTFVSVYESDVEHIIVRGNTCVRTGGSSNSLMYLNTTTPNPTSHKNITIDNNRLENCRLFDTDLGAVTGLVITNNYGRDVEWAIGFDDCTVTGLVFRDNDLTITNLLAAPSTIGSAAILNATISGNKLVMLPTSTALMRFPVSGFGIALRDMDFVNNNINATGMNASSYMLNFFNSVSDVTRCKFIGNTIRRGANFRFFTVTGSATTKTQFTDFIWADNITDGGPGFTDCDFTRATFAGNIIDSTAIGNISTISFVATNNTPVLDSVSITGNTFRSGINAGNNGVVVVLGVCTYNTPLLIDGNQFHTAADIGRAVYANASAVGNQIDFRNNYARGRFDDASGTFAIKPLGNRVTGTFGQVWKGGVAIDADGRYISETAPASGTWATGEIVYDPTPAAAGFIGYVCTAGGTPGTWNTWGAVSA